MSHPNKKLLETRLRSISHYQKEISDLETALGATKETLKSVTDSLVEFSPFDPEDIITDGYLIKKIIRLDRAYTTSGGPVFRFYAKVPIENYGRGGWSSEVRGFDITVKEAYEKWSVLIPAPIQESTES